MTFDATLPVIRETVLRALAEDIGEGDITSAATVPAAQQADGTFFAKQELVLAGVELLPLIYELRGGVDSLTMHHQSGDRLQSGDRIASVQGPARRLLECERVSLNFMQRLSGVATMAAKHADAVKGTPCKVLDTRKTTPGLRVLEKMAAFAGGATNHRMGLFDAILIKNNHIAAAGGVPQALQNAQAVAAGKPIEIEVRTWEEMEQALANGAKHLLLDNLTPEEASVWVRHIAGRATVELSGNISLHNIRPYAEAGADYVSCGAITHSATAVDMNFRLVLR